MTKKNRLGSDPLDWVGKDKPEEEKVVEGEGEGVVPEPKKPEPLAPNLHVETNIKARAERFSITLTPELLERFTKLYDSWRLVAPGLQKKDLYNKMVGEFLERYEAIVKARATKALK